jgi:hypothetical protein
MVTIRTLTILSVLRNPCLGDFGKTGKAGWNLALRRRWPMKGSSWRRRLRNVVWGSLMLPGLAMAAGCQVDVGGQTLPSPYYMHDDVQYFAPGPEFKLAREAAALQAARQEEALRR